MTDYMKQEYSDKFDELRRNRVDVSYHKYGPAKKNFQSGNVQALPTMERWFLMDCGACSALNLLCRKLNIKPMHLNKLGGGTGERMNKDARDSI